MPKPAGNDVRIRSVNSMNPIKLYCGNSRRLVIVATLLVAILSRSGQARAQQPTLVDVSPARGAVDVPVSASVVFTFSAPLDPDSAYITADGFLTGSIVFSANVNSTAFVKSWNDENTVLTLNYTGDLPGGEMITWKINPPTTYTSLLLMTEAADIVVSDSGAFSTAGVSCDPDGIPDEYGNASIFKSVIYSQTGAVTPILKVDEKPSLFVNVSSPANNGVTSASFTKPGSATPIPLTSVPQTGLNYFAEEFDSQALLDSAYGAGTYTLTLNRAVPPTPTVFSMQMPDTGSYPPIPQISNFTQAQSIDPTQEFTLEFNALTGATGSDFIQIEIQDAQFNTVLSAPNLCIPLSLEKTDTSFVIPANTLQSGTTYNLRLSFARTFYASTTAPPDFASLGVLSRQTVLSIATTGGVVVPQPQIADVAFQGGYFAFTVGNLTPATSYRLQYSTTLLPNSWTDLQPVTTSTPMPVFDLESSQTTGQRFYRVITP